MPAFSIDININHIYFFLIFLSYFIREVVLEIISNILKKDPNIDYTFGNSKNATKKLFNMYVYTIANFFSLFCICIISIRSKRKSRSSEELVKKKSAKDLQYIYTNDLPVNRKKILIKTLMLTICDFTAQFCVFLLYIFVNDDQKLEVKERFDTLCIFNILSKYLFSSLILKTRYYRHHYLSIIINIFCLILLGAFELNRIPFTFGIALYLLTRIFSQIVYSLEDVVGKKALKEEFLSPYSLLVYKGVYETIILLICSIPFLFFRRDGIIIFSKMKVFLNSYTKSIIYFILMICNFSYNIFIWTIIDRFSPNDYAMAMVIEGITDKLFALHENKDFNVGYFILGFIFYLILIFGISIHSEIIIINKCGLNEYTKKRVGTKGEEDYELATNMVRGNTYSFDDEEEIKQNKNYKRLSAIGREKGGNLDVNLDENISKSRSKSILNPITMPINENNEV